MNVEDILAHQLQGSVLNHEAKVVEQIFGDGSKKLRIEITTDAGARYRLPVNKDTSLKKGDVVSTSDLGAIVLQKAGQNPIVRYGLKKEL